MLDIWNHVAVFSILWTMFLLVGISDKNLNDFEKLIIPTMASVVLFVLAEVPAWAIWYLSF